MAQYGFHYDGTRCTGCKTCMLACKDYHNLPGDVAFRQVYEYGNGEWEKDAAGAWSCTTQVYYLSEACPYGIPKADAEKGVYVKCDGCKDRVAQGKKPICVEACPLRALDFGDIEQLRSDFGDVAAIAPLPDSSATRPNIVITPPAAACADVAGDGAVLNRCEIV